jgi:predicted metal-dependent TIM-barrel fold hydrolase
MLLNYTDCLLYPTQTSNKDLENLAFFGTKTTLVVSSLEEKANPIERWERLFTTEAPRLSRVGINPLIALGLPSEASPKNTWRELLLRLDTMLSQQRVNAIGPLSLGTLPRHQEAFVTQLQLAQKKDLPCLITLPPRGRLPYIDTVIALAKKEGLPAERIAFLHSTGKSVVRARSSGAYSVLTMHPSYLKTKTAAAILRRQQTQKILLASGLGPGLGDVLALQKLALAMGGLGFSSEAIVEVTQSNASRFFGSPQP